MSKTVLNTAQLRVLLKAFKEQHAAEYHLRALGYSILRELQDAQTIELRFHIMLNVMPAIFWRAKWSYQH